jgi:hypothetical protein
MRLITVHTWWLFVFRHQQQRGQHRLPLIRKGGLAGSVVDRLLMRLNANKPELLMVLDRPKIPLHTNGSENDIRCQVTRRKVSAGTRSDIGRDCRDAFLRSRQNLRQARNRVLGLPWRPTRHPGHSHRPPPARTHPRQSSIALTATGFAPLTKACAKALKERGIRT